ncbi:MAG TPA: 5-formyltetrahydrofolate cyclo-ligase [Methylomirabilota bacterium]|nr:5-formyltetrahydrofolate cyclo-ligase [Methylomirabilota bacterium]
METTRAGHAAASKQATRERVWSLLTERRVARFPGAVGRIPNFVGAEAAARRLAQSSAWQAARVIKCNPDAPQLPVRALALEQGKRVFMAVPRLREERWFLELDPRRLAGRERAAASIRGAGKLGKATLPKDMPRIELIVAGSVAVRRDGARAGKGGGFSDLEFALLTELGLVGRWTTVATTVHPLQIVSEPIPMLAHDIPLDLIVTPDETIRCPRRHRRPKGIVWSALTDEKIAEVPLLARLARERRRDR